MLRSILFSRRAAPVNLLLLFAIEGALLQFTGSINGFGNNLFATNLGATDSQIGLVQTIPNLAAMVLMLPLGVLADRARSPRTLPLCVLLVMAAGYLLMALVPSLGNLSIPLFFLALVFTVGGPAMYNAQWQALLGSAVEPGGRNSVLTQRNRFMFIVGIAAPILCGLLMGRSETANGKLQVLQLFFVICSLVTLAQAAVVSRIPAPLRAAGSQPAFSLRDIPATVRELAQSRAFLQFFLPVLFFYVTWQLDWSMWYIGQVQYLGMTETDLSISNSVFNIGQLVAVGVMSGVVRRRGNDYTLPFAALGLMSCPAIMVISSLLPMSVRVPAFTVMMAVLNAPQCAVNLCVVQILLRVVPEGRRGLAVSLFTLTTTLTNSFMPLLGVKLYTALGADRRALLLFNAIVFVLRLASWGLLAGRYMLLRRGGELTDAV